MPFLQMGKIKSMVKSFATLLALLVIAGCVAQNANKVETSEQQTQPESEVAKTIDNTTNIQNRQINSVRLDQQNENISIIIQGNQKLDYTSMKQSFPFGIAVYLLETELADDFKTNFTDNTYINDLIVSYADKEKTTVKIEILLDQDFDYEVTKKDNLLKVALSGGWVKSAVDTDKISDSSLDNEKSIQKIITQQDVIIPNKTAIMTNIEFNTMEDGKSDIAIQTNHPVKYDIIQGSDKKLYLNLYNTVIPNYHKRPIITKYFKSAVESLIPIQDSVNKKNAKIEINMREQVPYRVVRGKNNIFIFFEPSTMFSPEFKKAKAQISTGTQTQLFSANGSKSVDQSKTSQIAVEKQKNEGSNQQLNKTDKTLNQEERAVFGLIDRKMEQKFLGRPKEFKGEKLRLDFFETDIKNVFRIFSTVGKFNFAIDDDVQGKVTLSFDNPVPWDQALYTILRMNRLGMKTEDNIIRIATMVTLKEEEKELSAAIAAAQKRLAIESISEPQATEYFPINYAGATDIEPHIRAILTPARTVDMANKPAGTVSIAEFANMLIITDVQAKIDQSREIIERLDIPTPQIMIEAKIIEIDKSAEEKLGLGLAVGFDENTGTATGSADFGVAIDSALNTALGGGGINFSKIIGDDIFTLNANIAALETSSALKVISSPRILVMDNEEAYIEQGFEIPYSTVDEDGKVTIVFKEVPLKLTVTPHITPDPQNKQIVMEILIIKKDIETYVNGIPQLFSTEAKTKLLINDKETIVIGGIIKTNELKATYGVPWLSNIPVLGRLFRTDTDEDGRKELLIFITPTMTSLDD